MKVAIVAIAKWENNYIREFVSHYKKLGADKVIIGDNNEVNGERFDEVLKDFISEEFVVIKDYRGKIKQQSTFYTNVYREYSDKFDWIGFFDCDEFLHLTQHKNIQDFLTDSRYDKFKVIRINWKCYGDNGLIRVENNDYSLQKRFTVPVDKNVRAGGVFANKNSKTFIRGNLGDITINVHGNYSIKECCNDKGELIENKWCTDGLSWDVAYIKHYNTKTIEEWLKKMKRGYPDKNYNNKNMLSIDRFFLYNKKTPEKLKFIANNLNNKK